MPNRVKKGKVNGKGVQITAHLSLLSDESIIITWIIKK
jgi:hypothetical protein